MVSERYYNDNGEAYLDIDYTCHGRPNVHPDVPHIHRWIKVKTATYIEVNGRNSNEKRMY